MHYCNILTDDLFFSILLCFWFSWVSFFSQKTKKKDEKNQAADSSESSQPPRRDCSGLTSGTLFLEELC